jgi:hypothetical protein
VAEPDADNLQQSAQESQHRTRDSQQRSQNSQDPQREARIHELEDEVERYRRASEDTLQQLDWCIGYLHGSGKKGLARALSKNRAYIRTALLKRSEQPMPSEETNEG